MSEELGKIEKPPVESFKAGRRLYFVPLLPGAKEAQAEYVEKSIKYWEQVEDQVGDLELKLGKVSRIYHEFISAGGDDGIREVEELNDKSCQIINGRLEKGAQLEPTEERELLTEFMDWTRCLSIGLRNQKVFTKVYEFYKEATKKRNENIARQIDETLKADEIGILFMIEGHQVQFPTDIEVFYIAPPALDEIKRWLRGRESEEPEDE